MARVLVIDDEPGICRAFEKFLGKMGHEVRTSSRAETALPLAAAFEPDLVLLDVRLPGMSGLDALPKLLEQEPGLPVVVITAFGTMETAVAAMRRGAYDYLLKPLDLKKVSAVIDRALESRRIASEVVLGRRKDAAGARGATSRIVGRTAPMQDVFKRIGAVSDSDVPVLVIGESGTGKQMVARAVHSASGRAERPFETVNCADLPEGMLASEIFGYEEGACPAPGARRVGRVEAAEGGTVFLDDLAGLPPSVQVRLLDLLENGRFERLGGDEALPADVRLMAATTRPLAGGAEAGGIREDLYYRLSVMTIEVPPLRDRMADLPALVAHFLSGEDGMRAGAAKDTLRVLLEYSWPGNVRELKNAVEHALVLVRGGTILPEHLPEHVRRGAKEKAGEEDGVIAGIVSRALAGDVPEGEVFQTMTEWFERPLIAGALEATGGNQLKAAKLLGIHRTTLRAKILKYDM